MKILNRENVQNALIVRKIVIAVIAVGILTWAFFQNHFFGKVVIAPFLICAVAIIGGNISLLFNQRKIAHYFNYLFRVSLFTYIFGFLVYAFYYSITHQAYSLIIVIMVFLFFSINFFKATFLKK